MTFPLDTGRYEQAEHFKFLRLIDYYFADKVSVEFNCTAKLWEVAPRGLLSLWKLASEAESSMRKMLGTEADCPRLQKSMQYREVHRNIVAMSSDNA